MMNAHHGTRRHLRRTAVVIATSVTVSLTGWPLAGAEPPEGWDVEHAEISASKITVGAADSATMPDGTYRMFAVTNSAPDSRLVEIDPWAGVVLNSHELTGSTGSWGVHIAADGTVWASSHTQGIVYQLPWQSESVVAHPRATPDTSFVWEVDTDDAGNLYGGTFEGWADPAVPGRLIRIAPDGEQRVYEPFRDSDHYVRSTAVVGDTVYAGTGSVDGQLYELDPDTGNRSAIAIPAELGSCNFVYGLAAVGDDLAVRFQRCDNGETDIGYVLDLQTRTWLPGTIPTFSGAISQPAEDGTLYAASEGRIVAFDPETGDREQLSDSATSGTKDVELTVDPDSGAATVVSISLAGKVIRHTTSTPAPIRRSHPTA